MTERFVAMEIANVIYERMCAWAADTLDQRVAVALSGGVDSCACLAALMEVGHRDVKIISYTPSTHPSTDYKFARQTAKNLALPFRPAVVNMEADTLEPIARWLISNGWKRKLQVESLAPMVRILEVARANECEVMFTGDQSDGYFALSRFAVFEYDRKVRGLPPELCDRRCSDDETSERIDWIRTNYYAKDKSLSGVIHTMGQHYGVDVRSPFRDKGIFDAFLGSTWKEVNKPRIKEPIKLAFATTLHQTSKVVESPGRILNRPTNVNLHKGDSLFGDTFSRLLLEKFSGYSSPVGLFNAMARGEV